MKTTLEYHRYIVSKIVDQIEMVNNHICTIVNYVDELNHKEELLLTKEETQNKVNKWLDNHYGRVIIYKESDDCGLCNEVSNRGKFLEDMLAKDVIVKIVK